MGCGVSLSMIIKILSWNVRRVNDAEKRKLIKSVIRS